MLFFVMMGEDIKNLVDFPFYYWGGNYLGPLNNIAMALTQKVLELFSITQQVPLQEGTTFSISPYAASITCMWLFFLGTLFWGLSFKKFFNVYESLAACLLLSIGGALFMRTTLRPLAPEVAYLLGAIVTWRGAILIQNNNHRNQLLFGLIFGFSWWMNQITIFALAPIFFYFISQHDIFRRLRTNPNLMRRFTLQEDAIGITRISKPLKGFLYFLYTLASINFILGLVIAVIGGINDHYFGIRIKIHNGVSPMKTSILIFLITQFLLWLFKSSDAKSLLRTVFNQTKYFLSGFTIGFGPVIVGRVLNLYKKGYTPRFKFVPLEHLLDYWTKLYSDFIPRLLGPNQPLYTIPLFSILFVTIIYSFYRNREKVMNYLLCKPGVFPKVSILWAIPLFNLAYILICERSRDQYAFRYAILSLPVLAIYLATLHRRIPIKLIGIPLTIAACLVFARAQYYQGQEQINRYLVATNHEKKIQVLLESDCEVFFSNYWNTYIYEYFLQHKKSFAVIRGQDRTPEKTAKLRASSLKKCDLNEETFEITKI